MTFATLVYEKQDAVAWVTLSRPDVLNAYNIKMRDELYEVLAAIRDDSEVRAVVFRGAGRAFCAGADLTEFGTAPSPTAARRIRFARDVWTTLAGLEVPTIAAIHGYCFGSGLEMALFCDLRIARDDAIFGLPELHLGMIPAAGATQTLPRTCGESAALELLLTGRRIDAAEALRLRIVGRVFGADRFDTETKELASQLAALRSEAVRAVKRAVRAGADLPLQEGLRLEALLAASVRATSGPG